MNIKRIWIINQLPIMSLITTVLVRERPQRHIGRRDGPWFARFLVDDNHVIAS
jgi:hypothetical protein